MSKGNDKSEIGFAAITALLFLLILWSKYYVYIVLLYLKFRLLIAAAITAAIVLIFYRIKKMIAKKTEGARLEERIVASSPNDDSIFVGLSDKGRRINLQHTYRRMHAQVVGTTNAGKTESVIIPWAVDDMRRGRGVLIMDGKSDRELLDKLYAYAKRHGRENDIRILSICDTNISHTFNPVSGGSALEITERIFSALTFDSEYFKSIQYEATLQTLLVFEALKMKATPARVLEFLRSPAQITHLANLTKKKSLMDWASMFSGLTREEREQRTSGLLSQLQVFAVGETAPIFNCEKPDIDLDRALAENHIIYCQLPVLKIPTLGKMVGKFVLQALQSATASRHLGGRDQNKEFFSVYLDDFSEYLTKEFVSTLNKSRSAKVLITFAHQALGDLAVLGEDVKNSIQTNANLKVYMRTNEPTSAEYFSEVIGTSATSKVTERQTKGLLGASRTGEGSVRDVEEFRVHPNVFKQELGVGEGVMIIPHPSGSLPVRLKFKMLPDLDAPKIPNIFKTEFVGLDPVPLTDQSQKENSEPSQAQAGSNLPDGSAAANVLGSVTQETTQIKIERKAS